MAGAAHGGHGAAGRGFGGHGYARHFGRARHAWAYGGHLQCVPFARSDSGIELQGNASVWWNEAAGRYERGSRPEPGSVLSFSANGRMRLGHVAVVSNVVNAREIEIDHANWWGPGSYGGVTRGVPVVDVSPNNDWTEVRVALGNGSFGSVYRTRGFIYDRPDQGMMVANNAPASPPPALDAAPAQHFASTGNAGFQTISGPINLNVEVAEAPDDDVRSTGTAGYRGFYRGTGRAGGHGWGRHAGHVRLPLDRGAHRAHAGAGGLHAARLTGHHHRG